MFSPITNKGKMVNYPTGSRTRTHPTPHPFEAPRNQPMRLPVSLIVGLCVWAALAVGCSVDRPPRALIEPAYSYVREGAPLVDPLDVAPSRAAAVRQDDTATP
jgi:hypothetical protein